MNNKQQKTYINQECENCSYGKRSMRKGFQIFCNHDKVHTRYQTHCRNFSPSFKALRKSLYKPIDESVEPEEPERLMITLTPATMSAIQDMAEWLHKQEMRKKEKDNG